MAAPDAEQHFSLILEDRQQKISEARTRGFIEVSDPGKTHPSDTL